MQGRQKESKEGRKKKGRKERETERKWRGGSGSGDLLCSPRRWRRRSETRPPVRRTLYTFDSSASKQKKKKEVNQRKKNKKREGNLHINSFPGGAFHFKSLARHFQGLSRGANQMRKNERNARFFFSFWLAFVSTGPTNQRPPIEHQAVDFCRRRVRFSFSIFFFAFLGPSISFLFIIFFYFYLPADAGESVSVVSLSLVNAVDEQCSFYQRHVLFQLKRSRGSKK